MPEIKAIIFDYGGIVVNETDPIVFRYITEKFDVNYEIVALAMENLVERYQVGEISDFEFWKQFSNKIGRNIPENYEDLWIEKYAQESRKKLDILKLLNKLRNNKYKLGVLSNTIPPYAQYNLENHNYDCFDVVILSCNAGMRKPNKNIYKLILNKLETKPHETIFIDDKAEYVEAAESIGIKGILFNGCENLIDELKKIGVKI